MLFASALLSLMAAAPLPAPAADKVDPIAAEIFKLVEESFTRISIDINSKGMVTSCTVIERSGSDKLDEEACRIVSKSAKYVPARAPNGKPIATTRTMRITWRIEE